MKERTKAVLVILGLLGAVVGFFVLKSWSTSNQEESGRQFDNGVWALRGGNEPVAIECFTEAIRLSDTVHSLMADYTYSLAPVYYNRGLAHLWKKDADPDLALLDFTEALRHDGSLARCYWARGQAYLLKKELAKANAEFDEAIQAASVAIQKDQHDTEAYELRADAYEGKGDKERAKIDRERASRARVEKPVALFRSR